MFKIKQKGTGQKERYIIGRKKESKEEIGSKKVLQKRKRYGNINKEPQRKEKSRRKVRKVVDFWEGNVVR